MGRRSQPRLMLLLLAVPGVVACTDKLRVVDALDPTRHMVLDDGPVTALAGAPDGTLFATTRTGLFRRGPGDSVPWAEVSALPFHTIELHARAAGEVYLLPQMSGDIWLWQGGDALRALATPLSDSIIRDGHHTMGVPLVSLAGHGSDTVVAVGDRGAIVRYSKGAASLEPSPLDSVARRPAPEWFASALWGVDSRGERLYAATRRHVLERSGGTWRILDLPPEATGRSIGAIAATSVGVALSFEGPAGRPHLFVRDGTRWIDLSGKLNGITPALAGGRGQADGSALFWALGSYVVEVQGTSVRIYRVRGLGAIRGVVRSGRHIFAAGTHDGRLGLVVRLTEQ